MYTLLAECAIRAALIGAATALVLFVLRVRMAAARHAAWAAVTLTMLLLPVWTAWGPKAHLRVLPAAPVAAGIDVALAPLSLTAPVASSHGTTPGRSWSWWDAAAGIYLLGLSLLVARIAVGVVRARWLVRHAAVRDGILTSSACTAPITVGWLRPWVILPDGWHAWPQAQLDAVLAHERTHAARRDPLVHALALVNRAVFWFHPLAWWLERRLSALAEEACDANVLAQGHDAREYCGYLLSFARAVQGRGLTIDALGTAMPGAFLGTRLQRILSGMTATKISRWRVVVMTFACAGASALFGAASVDRQAPVKPAPNVAAVRVAEPIAVPEPAPADKPVRKARVLLAQAKTTAPAAVPASQQLIAMYFDLDSMTEVDRTRAAEWAEKYVRTQVNAKAAVAVLSVSNDGVKVHQDFTADRDLMVQAIHSLPGASGGVSTAQRLTALETAIKMLGTIGEKKALFYLTAGSLTRDEHNDAALRGATNAAIRAKVAIYTIDARGLFAQ